MGPICYAMLHHWVIYPPHYLRFNFTHIHLDSAPTSTTVTVRPTQTQPLALSVSGIQSKISSTPCQYFENIQRVITRVSLFIYGLNLRPGLSVHYCLY